MIFLCVCVCVCVYRSLKLTDHLILCIFCCPLMMMMMMINEKKKFQKRKNFLRRRSEYSAIMNFLIFFFLYHVLWLLKKKSFQEGRFSLIFFLFYLVEILLLFIHNWKNKECMHSGYTIALIKEMCSFIMIIKHQQTKSIYRSSCW